MELAEEEEASKQINETNEKINALLSAVSADSDVALIVKGLKSLRNCCPLGHYYQKTVAENEPLNAYLEKILFKTKQPNKRVHQMALQLFVNCIVGNPDTQKLVWERYSQEIVDQIISPPLAHYNDIYLMIMFNIHRGGTGVITDEYAFQTCVMFWKKSTQDDIGYEFEFLHLFFESFLVNQGRIAARCYNKLSADHKIDFLHYIVAYISQSSPNGLLDKYFLQHLSKEFKMKSDSILRASTTQAHVMDPHEVKMLLRVIAGGSGSDDYASVYKEDHSLFLNVSSLLRSLVELGKTTDVDGPGKPMTKLEDFASTSKNREMEVTFELKTLLVRCTANLLYNNAKNKEYCLDTNLINALLECTQLDASNPLIREWSILAIRNACIDCPQIQEIIENLTMKGMAKNDILSELNLEMGSLRISANQP